jgi:hypothetical protein
MLAVLIEEESQERRLLIWDLLLPHMERESDGWLTIIGRMSPQERAELDRHLDGRILAEALEIHSIPGND